VTAISTTGAVPSTISTARKVDPSNYRPALIQVGVIVWLASELMFFSGLFAAYFSLRAATPVWPPKGDTLDVPPVLVATILLVLSSFTMQLRSPSGHQGIQGGLPGVAGLTFVLGGLFEGMQISDYIGRPFAIDTDAYGSAFYTLTGSTSFTCSRGCSA
jgi:cytochrome c oxidase subunit 3